MSSQALIRELKHDDLDALLALYVHLHPKDEPLPDDVATIWRQIIEDPGQIYLGAFLDGILVASCNATVVLNLTRGARPYALVENVVTHGAYRRRGIGKALIQALLERCWARGCYKVMLMSGMNRESVYGFYEAVGFDRHAKQAFVIKAS